MKHTPKGMQFGKLSDKEINLIRQVEDVVGAERLTIMQICLRLGITNLMEQHRVQDLLNYITAKKDPSTTLRKDSEGYFYNEIGEKTILRALRDFPGFYDRQRGKKMGPVRKGDLFTAPPEIAQWLVKKGYAEIVSKVETKNGGLDPSQSTLSSLVLQNQEGSLDDSEAKGKEC